MGGSSTFDRRVEEIKTRENLGAGPVRYTVYRKRAYRVTTATMTKKYYNVITPNDNTRSSTLAYCDDNNIIIIYLGGGGTRDLSCN